MRLIPILSMFTGALAAQANERVLPSFVADVEATGVARGPFANAEFRWQQIWRGEAIARRFAVLTELALRRDNGQKSVGRTFQGRTIRSLVLELGHTAVAPENMSTAFARNVTNPMTTVLRGAFNLPTQPPPAKGAAPFNIRLPLSSAFSFARGSADHLLAQMTAAPGSTRSGDYNMDAVAAGGVVGSRFTRYGSQGPFRNGDIVAFDVASDFLEFGPNGPFMTFVATGLKSGYTATLALGTSDKQLGRIPLPFDLGLVGAPGNSLLTSVDLLVPLPVAPRGTAFAGRAVIPLPNNPSIGGVTLFAQSLFADPPSNALGIVTSAGLRFTFGSRVGQQMQSLVAPDARAATGTPGFSRGGLVTRWTGVFQ